MNKFDFGVLGGMPLTQETLEWMQNGTYDGGPLVMGDDIAGGYLDAINAMAGLVDVDEPVALTGIKLTAGDWNSGTVSNGWIYHPEHGVIPFRGGDFTSTEHAVEYKHINQDLTFKNNSTHAVKKRVEAVINSGVSGLRALSENRWGDALGADRRSSWESGAWESGTGTLEAMYDSMTDLVHVRGSLEGGDLANYGGIGGSGDKYIRIGRLPKSFLPSEKVSFVARLKQVVIDSNDTHYITLPGYIDNHTFTYYPPNPQHQAQAGSSKTAFYLYKPFYAMPLGYPLKVEFSFTFKRN